MVTRKPWVWVASSYPRDCVSQGLVLIESFLGLIRFIRMVAVIEIHALGQAV